MAQRLSGYLQRNHLTDISVQKAGISGISGCLEPSSTIWHQIQVSKKEGTDRHIVFLNLVNTCGSIPHNLFWTAFDFFRITVALTRLMKVYFQDMQLCLMTTGYTTAWRHLEVGIMASCTISTLAFTMAMEMIIIASRWVVRKQHIQPRLRLPPIRARQCYNAHQD